MDASVSALVPQLVDRIKKRGNEPFEPVFDKVMDAAQAEHGLTPEVWLELREKVWDALAVPEPKKSPKVRRIRTSHQDVVSFQDLAAGEKRPGKAS